MNQNLIDALQTLDQKYGETFMRLADGEPSVSAADLKDLGEDRQTEQNPL